MHTHRILTRTGSSHVLADTVLSQTVLADRLASVTFVRRSLCTDQPPWYVRTCLGLHPEQESEGESEQGSELVRIERVVGAHPAVAGHLPWRSLDKTVRPFLLAMAMQGPVSSGLVGYFSDQDRLGSAVRTAHPAEDEAERTSSLKTVVNWPIAPAPSLQDGFRTSN